MRGLWIVLLGTWIFAIGIIVGTETAHADPCFLPYDVPPRVAPAGMDDYMWPPCEATYHQWQVPAAGGQPKCPSIDGNPGGLWCIYTDPGNGKTYVIGKGINQGLP